MSEAIKVSIIIPVYNVEKYLDECLKSAINQTLDNIDIIAINDGSTDNSLKILLDYEKKFNNIKVISQSNKGLSEARNKGLEIAKGDYVYFLDSDDYIDLNCIKDCYDYCEKYNLDIINFDAKSFKDDPNSQVELEEEYDRKKLLNSDVYSGEDFYNYLMENDSYRQPVWLNMYKREFLEKNKLYFYPGLIHEDELFTKLSYLKCSKIMYIPKQFFNRRVRSNSIMTTKINRSKVESLIIIAENIYDYLKMNRSSLKEETTNNVKKYCESLYSLALRRNELLDGSQVEKVELKEKIISSVKATEELYSFRLKIQAKLPQLYNLVYTCRLKMIKKQSVR